MKSKAVIFIALVLALSVFAQENSHNVKKDDGPLHTNTYIGYGHGIIGGGGGGGGGSGSGGGSYSVGINHGGVYGGGQICKWGCCGESVGYSYGGGTYYSCNCCATFAAAEAYRASHPKLAENKN